VQTAITAAIVGGGGILAIGSAADLYRSRGNMASQFQQDIEFPIDLIQPQIDRNFFMAFKFMKYEKRAIQRAPFLRSRGSVRLPIPDNIKDNMSVSYTTPSLGSTVGAILDSMSGGTPSGTPGTVIDQLRGTLETLGAGAAGFATQFVEGNANRQAVQGASNYFGMAVNPYQTVLFEKPEFKSHNFSWKIMPRNEEESSRARNIFRTFQYHMSPGISGAITGAEGSGGSGLFFSYPSMVIVSLYPNSEFMYRFKPCVLKSVNVNYAAGSAPSFFKRTNAPTAMTISIQLQEIEYWTNNDFTGDKFNDDRAEREAFLATPVNNITTGSGRGTSGP
jgi:hypothetical protein